MIFSRLYLIPLLLLGICLAGYVTTYSISVALDHVRPILPYISDTGTTPPESTIFGQVLNIAAVINYIVFYIRCKQVKTLYSDPDLPHYSKVARLNRISLWISLPVALGTSMVANFQETNAIVPHLIGAGGTFLLAAIYFWLHTIISYFTCPIMNTFTMAKFRLFVTIVCSLSAGGTGLFATIAYFEFRKKKSIIDLPKWGPDDPAFEMHLVSTISEHIVMISFGCYILTFIGDFKNIVLHSPKVEKLNCTNSQTTDINIGNININSLDNFDKKLFDDDKGNFVKAADIGKGGSTVALV